MSDGTLIDVAPGQYPESVSIFNTSRSMTIRGAGPAATALVANGTGFSGLHIRNATGAIRIESLAVAGVASSFVAIGGGFTLVDSSPTFVNVHFSGNFSAVDGGGGILTRANPVFDTCLFDSNTASRLGGGILVTGSRPIFLNTTIQNNVSGFSSNVGAGGGMNVNDGVVTIANSIIRNNRSKFDGGGISALGPFGSAFGPTVLAIQDSEISGNVTSRYSGADPPAVGGAIHTEDNVIATITRSTIRNNAAEGAGGLNILRGRLDVISSFVEGNVANDSVSPQGGFGGGISALSASPGVTLNIIDSVIRNNVAQRGGGAIVAAGIVGTCNATTPLGCVTTMTISSSLIDNNTASGLGGGLYAGSSIVTVSASQILRNVVDNAAIPAAGQAGGGVALVSGTTANISGSTIASNRARVLGGGFYVDQGSVLNVDGSVIHKNATAFTPAMGGGGGGIYVATAGPSGGTVSNTDIADNDNFQIREDACPGTVSPSAPILSYLNNRITPKAGFNDFYMSVCAPPGSVTSIGAFNALSASKTVGNSSPTPSFASFTSTPDKNTSTLPTVLGWSVARSTSVNINQGVGSGLQPTFTADVMLTCPTTYTLTRVPQGGTVMTTALGNPTFTPLGPGFLAYPAGFTGGVNLAFGNVSGTPAVITGAGPGGGPHVRVLRASDGSPMGEFLAYDPAFTGGVFVAFAPNIGGQPAIITGPGAGGGPHIKVFRINGTPVGPGAFAYNPLFTGGVSVGFAPNLPGGAAILTAPGAGGGPHVRAFNVDAAGNITPRGGGIFAYNPAFTGGVSFAVGDVTGDGNPEVITAPGPGGGPHVRLFNVDAGGNFTDVGNGGFFAFEATFTGGVSIAVGNTNGSGNNELITSHGAGSPLVRIYSVSGAGVATAIAETLAYDPAFIGGVRVASGNVDGDARDEIVTAPGPGGGPHVKLFKFPCP